MNKAPTCLALCYNWLCGDIGFVYPAMSMVVIGPSLLKYTKKKSVESAVWCLLTRIDDGEQSAGSKYLNTVQDQDCSFLFWTMNK